MKKLKLLTFISTKHLILLVVFVAYCLGPFTSYDTRSSNQTVVYINFSLPSTQKRMYVVKDGKVVYSTYVAHGSGSGRGIYPTTFSNAPNSHASSLGRYIAGSTYKGSNGPSRRLYGVSKSNSNVYSRSIVIHGAVYIGNGRIGTSWGCLAVPFKDLNTILFYTQPGTIIIVYKQ